MAYNRRDDDLAYGEYNPGRDSQEEQDRGMIGDMGRRLFGGKKEVSIFSTNADAVIVHPDPQLWVSSRLEADPGSHSAERAVLLAMTGDLLLPSPTSAFEALGSYKRYTSNLEGFNFSDIYLVEPATKLLVFRRHVVL
jgi:hypothetical protein